MLGIAILTSVLCGASLFDDDFEGPNLLSTAMPPGKWAGLTVAPGCTAISSGLAAHRGLQGFHVVDGSMVDLTSAQLAIYGLPASATAYARLWFQFSMMGAADSNYPVFVREGGPGYAAFFTVKMRQPSNAFQLEGVFDVAGDYLDTDAGTLSQGAWHLLEVWATGIGTADAGRTLWIDGLRTASVDHLDWTGRRLDNMFIGLYSSTAASTGTYDFDDVRLDTSIQASSLIVSPAAHTARAGECLAADVALRTSPGDDAGAPYGVTVALSGAPFFGDARCSTPITDVTLPPNAMNAPVWLKPLGPGPLTLLGTQADFLSRSTTVDVSGPLDGPALRVGCGCSATDAWPALLLLGFAALTIARLRSDETRPRR